MITTLHHFYDISGDAESYGLALVLSSFCDVASIVLLSKVVDLLAKLNYFMHKQAAKFSRKFLILDSIEEKLKLLRKMEQICIGKLHLQLRNLKMMRLLSEGESLIHGTVSLSSLYTLAVLHRGQGGHAPPPSPNLTIY